MTARTPGIYYEHSGSFPLLGTVMAALVGAAAGTALAVAYAYLALYIPLAGYITFVLAGGFGLLTGGATAAALKSAKVRSFAAALVVALAVGLLALYVSWGVWIYALLRRENQPVGLASLLLDPGHLWAWIRIVNEAGPWKIGGFAPTGALLWLLWVLEALIVVGVTVLVAAGMILEEPFCERCEVWCKKTPVGARLAAGDAAELKARMEVKDFAFLERQGPASPEAAQWWRLDLHSCRSCGLTNTLTVAAVTLKVDQKGNRSENARDLLDKLLLSPSEVEAVRRLAGS